MTSIDFDAPAAERGRGRLFARIADVLTPKRARRARPQTVPELSDMDAELLRDLGIEPQDVSEATRARSGPIWLNPV